MERGGGPEMYTACRGGGDYRIAEIGIPGASYTNPTHLTAYSASQLTPGSWPRNVPVAKFIVTNLGIKSTMA